MECISVFDMLKIGVGPSSSHTLGPWRAAEQFLAELRNQNIINDVHRVKVDLYGSLSLTGKGHATDYAVMLGLSGADPELVPIDDIASIIEGIKTSNELIIYNELKIHFKVHGNQSTYFKVSIKFIKIGYIIYNNRNFIKSVHYINYIY